MYEGFLHAAGKNRLYELPGRADAWQRDEERRFRLRTKNKLNLGPAQRLKVPDKAGHSANPHRVPATEARSAIVCKLATGAVTRHRTTYRHSALRCDRRFSACPLRCV